MPSPPVGPGASGRAARERHLAELSVLVVMVLWGGNFVVVKAAIAIVPPIGYALIRFTLACVSLFLVLRWREGSVGLPRRDIIPVAVLGFLGFGLYQMLWPVGLGLIPAGDAAILGATTPVLTALIAVPAGSDVLTRSKGMGALVAFLGVGLVVAAGTQVSLGSSLLGDGLIFGAATCWALYAAFGAPMLRRHSPLRMTAWAMTFGTLSLVPAGLWQLRDVDPSAFGIGVMLAILYSAFLSAGVANVVVLRAVKLLGPTRITAYQFFIPAVAVFFAFVFLSEPVRPAQIAGGVVILAGVILARRDQLIPRRVRARFA